MGTLKQYLDDEMRNLNKLLIQKKLDERQDIVDDTGQLLQRFKKKRSNLPVFCVSSKNYTGMEEVKQCLIKVAQEKRIVPESWVEFYKQILESKKIYLTVDDLFVVLRRFQHCTGHITTGSWKGRGNQYI